MSKPFGVPRFALSSENLGFVLAMALYLTVKQGCHIKGNAGTANFCTKADFMKVGRPFKGTVPICHVTSCMFLIMWASISPVLKLFRGAICLQAFLLLQEVMT